MNMHTAVVHQKGMCHNGVSVAQPKSTGDISRVETPCTLPAGENLIVPNHNLVFAHIQGPRLLLGAESRGSSYDASWKFSSLLHIQGLPLQSKLS